MVDIPEAEIYQDCINLSPNPATSEITVDLSGSPDQISKIVILDIKGTEVKHLQKSGNSFQIQISDLPQGIYILRLFKGNFFQVKRFIKI